MKFSCEKILLQNAITTVSRAVATKTTVPALEGLLLEGHNGTLTLSAYNLQIGIRCCFDVHLEEEGNIVLNARLLGEIIRKMPDDIISLDNDKPTLTHICCGDASFQIPTLNADDFPELPTVEENVSCILKQSTLKTMIATTSFAVSTNESRMIHTGSLFEVNGNELTLVAVDGFRLALRKEECQNKTGGDLSFVVPGAAQSEIERICADNDNEVSITVGPRHIQFEIDQTTLVCRRLEGEFLDYKKAIPQDNPIVLYADKKSLLNSIDRVSVVISDKLKSPVSCIFGDGHVKLSAKTAIGESRDTCPIEGKANDLEIGFNNRYLTEALRYAPAEEIQLTLNTPITPCIILPKKEEDKDRFLYMVLPVRLNSNV